MISGDARSTTLRQFRALFEAGTVAALTDGQLLERFLAEEAGPEGREAAFAALVARHGPMVLGVCRRALADPGEAADAFQATFLVLLRKARSVRVDDSLGRWLYGVSRKVAARARLVAARQPRGKGVELVAAPAVDPDRFERLMLLDEELGRLPERFRSAIVLCDLEGLTHEEAARALSCPMGTIKSRLARGRARLRERLERRGLAPSALALPPVVPASLLEATAGLAATGGTSASAAAVALAGGVIRGGMAGLKLKLAVAAGLLALAGAGGAGLVAAGGAGPVEDRGSPLMPADDDPSPAARPADAIVAEIEALLRSARRPLSREEWFRIHGRIAATVEELRRSHPDDPRGRRLLPDRWNSLLCIEREAEAGAEIGRVEASTADASLARDARFFGTILRFQHPIDGPEAASLAGAFERLAPDDPRSGELLYLASTKLGRSRLARLALAAAFGLAAALAAITFIRRRWWGRAARLAGLALGLAAVGLVAHEIPAPGRLRVSVTSAYLELIDPEWHRRAGRIISGILAEASESVPPVARGGRGAFAVALALAAGIGLVAARRRRAEGRPGLVGSARLGASGFLAALALAFAADAGVVAVQEGWVRGRIARDHPDSFRGRIVRGERRQVDRAGEPFELDFADAITGRPVSLRSMRGKVVVVDFWATWCGPCLDEIPELTRLYREYHDRGVEFVGVSLDLPEEDGGLADLREEVADRQIPWPQYYVGHDSRRARRGVASGDFAESWGVTLVPTVFLIDRAGNLITAEARGRLDTLIPRLLEGTRR